MSDTKKSPTEPTEKSAEPTRKKLTLTRTTLKRLVVQTGVRTGLSGTDGQCGITKYCDSRACLT